jgi:superfamily II DNA or RNA helicase
LRVTASNFGEITTALQEAGANQELAGAITNYLKYTVELPEEAAARLRMSPEELARRRLAFHWLEWLIKDRSRREELAERIRKALTEGELDAETRHIASWGDTGVPVVIYTGKMTKAERQGLIEAFAGLPRAVLISTPAVEVGVDFAADVLITEQCDGNGFLQRFGRVGRRPGIQAKVIVLVRDGETYVRLFQRHRSQMSREEFSTLIADPRDGVFPARLYAEGSAFLDATHWLVNAQLGEVGNWLNQGMFGEETAELARQMRSANLPFAYGLRGTLPEVTLQGGGGGEPFYILRKVPNDRLLPERFAL